MWILKILALKESKSLEIKTPKIYDIVLSAQQKAINGARSGMKASNIDKIARDYIEKSGYGEIFCS